MVNNSSKVGGGGDSGGGADSGGLSANLMSTEELRDLFSLRQHTLSDTYDSMCGDDGGGGSGGDDGSGNGEGGCAVSGGEVHKQQACFVILCVCNSLVTATPFFCTSHLLQACKSDQQRWQHTTWNENLPFQIGAPAEEDLKSWGQHSSTETVPDEVMRFIGRHLPGAVSFVFSCQARRTLHR